MKSHAFRSPLRSNIFIRLTVALALLSVTHSVQAVGLYWDTNAGTTGLQAGNGTWDNGVSARWNPTFDGAGTNNLVTFAATDDAFITVGPSILTVPATGVTANSLQGFSATNPAFTIVGGPVTLTSVGTVNTAAVVGATATAISLNNGANVNFASNLVLGAAATTTQVFGPQGGALTFNGGISDAGVGVNLLIALNTSASRLLQFNGPISVAGLSVTQGGSGNTGIYVGGNITTSGVATFNNTQGGSTGGFYQLAGSNTFTGGLVLNAGILSVGSDLNLGGASSTITFNGPNTTTGGALLINGAGLTGFGTHTVNFTATKLVGIDVVAGASFTVDRVLNQTTGGFSKNNAGDLTLNQANTYTGATILRGGTVTLDYAANDTSKISTSGALTLQGTTLVLNGGTFAQTVGSTTLNAGTNTISQTGGTATLALGGITRAAGSTLALSAGGIATTSSALGGASSLATTAAGVLGVVGGNDWIARDATTGLVGLSTVDPYTPATSTTLSGNADITAGTDTTLAGGGSASTLRFNQAEARTVTIGGGQILTLTQGGVLVTSAANGNLSTITGGYLSAGSNDALHIIQNSTGGLNIASVIADRIQTATIYVSTPLTKSGTGTLTLSGANTYTGQTFVNRGVLSFGTDGQIGGANGVLTIVASLTTSNAVTFSGPLPPGFGIGSRLLGQAVTSINPSTSSLVLGGNAGTALVNQSASWATSPQINLNGGTLQATASLSLTETNSAGAAGGTQTANRAIVLGSNGGTIETGPGVILTVPGIISSTAANQSGGLTKTGAGTLILSGGNTFTGGVTLNAGTIQLGNANGLGMLGQVFPALTFGAASNATLSLNGSNATLSALNGDTTAIVQSNSGAGGTNLLTINNPTASTFAGVIRNGASQPLAITKGGAGTLTLSGTNTYTGATTIIGGNLAVTGSLTASSVTVGAGGTLSGTGSIGGSVTANTGGHLAFSVAATTGAQVPLAITGTLTITGGATIDLTAVPTPANGDYILASAIGGITYTPGAITFSGVTGSVEVVGNDLVLHAGPPTGYSIWATANGIGGQSATGDFDSDGLTNFTEYALGKNPKVSSQPAGTLTGGTLSFIKGADAIVNNDVVYEIQESTDLGISDPWQTVVTEGTADDTPTIDYVLPTGMPREFARLKTTQVP